MFKNTSDSTTSTNSFQHTFDLFTEAKDIPNAAASQARPFRGARGRPATITKATARKIKADLAATKRGGGFRHTRNEVARRHGTAPRTVEGIERGRYHRDVYLSAKQEEALHLRRLRMAKPSARGEDHSQAKMTDEDALIAVGMHFILGMTQREAGVTFGVTPHNISQIVNRRSRPEVMACFEDIRADPEALKGFAAELITMVNA